MSIITDYAVAKCNLPNGLSIDIKPEVLNDDKSIITIVVGDSLLTRYFQYLAVPTDVKECQNQDDNKEIENRIVDQIPPRWGQEYAQILLRRYPGGMQASSSRFAYPINKTHVETMDEMQTVIRKDSHDVIKILGEKYLSYLKAFYDLWSNSKQEIAYSNEFRSWINRETAEWTLVELVSKTGFALSGEMKVYLRE